MADNPPEPRRESPAEPFHTTHWSVVMAARDGESDAARRALEDLCRCYWPPIYAYLRRVGYSSHDAQDLAQGFFARFLERGYLQRVQHGEGRFRSFLLVYLKRFLSDERDKVMAAKRGGGRIVSWEDCSLEEQRQPAPAHLNAGEAYDRRWAMALLERAQSRLRQEYSAAGKETVFEELQAFLSDSAVTRTGAELAEQLKVPENSVKSLIHRLRRRYGELIRQEVAQTVEAPPLIDDEIRYLLSVVAR